MVVFEKNPAIVGRADIITNLGMVRPIDRRFISLMKPTAAIPLMCEAWEAREGDVDLEACEEKGIPVMATNEDHPDLDVFNASGILCVKMLFQSGLEIYGNKITVLSNDKFGRVIAHFLEINGAQVSLVFQLKTQESRSRLYDSDALVVADYTCREILVGPGGHITGKELFKIAPSIRVIQFCGPVDIEELRKQGISYYPEKQGSSFKMGMTFADLGPRPVIDLHCAGIKVGEAMARARMSGLGIEETKLKALEESPAQNYKR